MADPDRAIHLQHYGVHEGDVFTLSMTPLGGEVRQRRPQLEQIAASSTMPTA
jgi:hypothetical protein